MFAISSIIQKKRLHLGNFYEKAIVGMWMYENGGGDKIQQKIVGKLRERGIKSITGLNLKQSYAQNGHIICNETIMEELDLFFSYNAGEQTAFQVYMYEVIGNYIPTINNYKSFALTEDKFQTIHTLRRSNIMTPDFKFCSRDETWRLKEILKKWGGNMVYKPTEGWGGIGIVKIESESGLDMLLPFLNQTNLRHFYVEEFIENDHTDYRIDIVDGKFIACYGRRASPNSWKTNVTSGGSVFLREPNDKLVTLAKKAAKATGLEIAGVDIIYDNNKEEYVVLEVNGIPAFATPEQEEMGLDFNDKKIDAIIEMIDKKIKEEQDGKKA